jgi:glutamate---cysteine ligase / carboxylate-amine ligase
MIVAALCRALVETAAREARHGSRPDGVRTHLLRAAMWQAARSGGALRMVDPVEAQLAPAWNLIDKLVDHVSAALTMGGDASSVDAALPDIQVRGTGADEQRTSYGLADRCATFVLDAIERTTA